MSNLEVRKIPFDFEGIPFVWNPEQPRFAILMNQISFFVIGFERYICKATLAAESRITDPDIANEARLFRQQEAVHSVAHHKHAKALIDRYPGLQSSLDKIQESYGEVYETHSLEYHLAYAGGLEAIFTPFFKLVLDNRAALFGGGDSRVVSMLLWHFCEEIEHRRSALTVYNHVVGDYWFRIKNTPGFHRHTRSLIGMLADEFKEHVPDVPDQFYEGDPFSDVPRTAWFRSAIGILNAHLPWHDPIQQPLPDYYEEWLGHWTSGDDVTRIYGRPPIPAEEVR